MDNIDLTGGYSLSVELAAVLFTFTSVLGPRTACSGGYATEASQEIPSSFREAVQDAQKQR